MNSKKIYCSIILIITVSNLNLLPVPTTGISSEVGNDDVSTPRRVSSPRELANQIKKALLPASIKDLDQMAVGTDCNLALAAGWERVRRTVPEAEQEEWITPDAKAVSRFLGLLEGRVQCPIPEEWETIVKSARARRRSGFQFSCPNLGEDPLPGHGFLRRLGRQWIVKKGREIIKLPLEGAYEFMDLAAVEFDEQRAFSALYGWPSIPYRLYATDRKSGEMLWSSSVWAAGGLFNSTGSGWHYARIHVVNERVVVFGWDHRTLYVEVFDKKAGENLCRFSTAYLE